MDSQKSVRKKHMLLVVNVDWFFLSHCKPIAVEALKRGYKVTVTAIAEENRAKEIEELGCEFVATPFKRGNINPFVQLKQVFFFYSLYKKLNPDIVHHFSIKNNLYGSVAARLTKVPQVINTMTGLGALFHDHHKFYALLKQFLRYVFMFGFRNKRAKHLFENQTDKQYFEKFLGLDQSKTGIIDGAGIDLKEFDYSPEPDSLPIKVVLASRLIKDKGILEFERAAALLKDLYKEKIAFVLAGKIDSESKTGITQEEIDEIQDRGNVTWIGNVDDMPSFYASSHIITLPSYGDGLPKSLMEACAIGRPIVTTDAPGCSEMVREEKNGFVVPMRDHLQLAEKIKQLYLDKKLRNTMGLEGRKLAEEKFAVEKIVENIFAVYDS